MPHASSGRVKQAMLDGLGARRHRHMGPSYRPPSPALSDTSSDSSLLAGLYSGQESVAEPGPYSLFAGYAFHPLRRPREIRMPSSDHDQDASLEQREPDELFETRQVLVGASAGVNSRREGESGRARREQGRQPSTDQSRRTPSRHKIHAKPIPFSTPCRPSLRQAMPPRTTRAMANRVKKSTRQGKKGSGSRTKSGQYWELDPRSCPRRVQTSRALR
jgi:hypothetical protein